MKNIKIIVIIILTIYFRSKVQMLAYAAKPKTINPGDSFNDYPELLAQKEAEIAADIEAARVAFNRFLLSLFRNNRGKDIRKLIIMMVLYVKRFPHAWDEFNIFVVHATSYLNTNKVRLELITDDLDTLLDLINNVTTGWVFVYEKTTNPLTNLKSWRDRRDILRNEIVLIMNTIEDGIRQALLTPEDRIVLHLPAPNHTHTQIGRAHV